MMRRHNGKLFRVARAILRDDAEAEDALQDAYLEAYRHIDEFRGGARLVDMAHPHRHQSGAHALAQAQAEPHRRATSRCGRVTETDAAEADVADERSESPPGATLRAEIRRALERRIDELPIAFRTVFVMREVEDMTVEETAECLAIPAATVRTRLFRARALLREALARDMDMATVDVFSFAGERCDRIVAGALKRLEASATLRPTDPIRRADGLTFAPAGTPGSGIGIECSSAGQGFSYRMSPR